MANFKSFHMGKKGLLAYLVASMASGFTITAQADSHSYAKDVIKGKCGTCHEQTSSGVNRISDSRRTPEGWDMTIGRMVAAHGLKISSRQRKSIVKYLSDTQGLAPEETADWRYILERDYGVIETHEDQLVGDTCARCHSYARVGLQARTAEDWEKLAHFHVGQFPTAEISAGGRDRDWFEIASKQVPPVLASLQPLDSKEWNSWKAKAPSNMAGEWRVVGHEPGKGDFEGVLVVSDNGNDKYSSTLTVEYQNGTTDIFEATSIVYTGYEWRGTYENGDKKFRQVFSVNADGSQLSGRYYQDKVFTIGGRMTAYKVGSHTGNKVLAASPSSVQVNETVDIKLSGIDMSGKITSDKNIKVVDVISRDKNTVIVRVQGKTSDQTGHIYVGSKKHNVAINVYKSIDYIEIIPEHPLAKVGGNGGTIPKQPIQFEAVAYSVGPDGKKGTTDDVNLGYVQAKWSVINANDNAIEMRDTEYAGDFLEGGLFVPGAAGPNKERKYKTNNVGELTVIAEVNANGKKLTQEKFFVVSVQRWNNPPIF
ncbi:MAG: quinohemoprotein amine dehydrogenase subunit alpha [Neptuniibacter sp.]